MFIIRFPKGELSGGWYTITLQFPSVVTLSLFLRASETLKFIGNE